MADTISPEERAFTELAQKRKTVVSSFATTTPYSCFGMQNSGSFPELDNELKSNNRAKYNVDELIPERLRDSTTETFRLFLEKYYEFEQRYCRESGGGEIAALHTKRDVDYGEEDMARKLFSEFVHGFPEVGTAEKKETILKQIQSFYLQKGSENSFRTLFKILFNEDPSVYYPWKDVLKSSDGQWNRENEGYILIDDGGFLQGFGISEGKFETNDGFLSDLKYVQDGEYYQQFSYDVRSEQLPEIWEPIHRKLAHPLGFALFTTLYLIIFSDNGTMPLFQRAVEYIPKVLVFLRQFLAFCEMDNVMEDGDIAGITVFFATLIVSERIFQNYTFTRLLFRNTMDIYSVKNVPINRLEENYLLVGISSYINHTEQSPPLLEL